MHIFNLFLKESLSLRKILFCITLFSLLFFCTPFQSHAESTAVTQNIYHAHIGDSSRFAGCYTIPNDTITYYEEKCPGKMVYFPDYDKSQCSFCGAAAYGDQSFRECYNKKLIEVVTTVYELGCGKSTKTVLGTFSAVKNTDDWTKEVELTMTLSLPGAVKKNSAPFIINGDACDAYTYTVNANGNYSIKLNNASGYSASALVMPVNNIDCTGPTLISYSLSNSDWTSSPVTVSLDSVSDLQPDNSEGCGLHEKPFSYDNGLTWTSENTHSFSSNSQITVMLRDRLENVSTATVSVQNIDNEPPRIISIDYDKTPNVKSVSVVVNADDIMSNGKEGSGLHESAYSFDNGKTWQSSNTILLDKCCTLSLCVRDRLGNISRQAIDISNIDCYGPVISYKLSPAGKTTGPVTITVTARDKGYGNSDGIGLPEECFSFDEGNSWTSQNTYKVSNNTKLLIMAKDKNDNTSKLEIKISNIGSASKPDTPPDPGPGSDDPLPPSEPDNPPVKPVITPTPAPKKVIVPKDVDPEPKPKEPTPEVKNVPKEPVKPKDKPKTQVTKEVIKEPVLQSEKTQSMDTLSKSKSDNNFKDFLIAFTCMAAGLLLILLLIFIAYRTVIVFNLETKKKFVFKGICLIRNKETLEITISQHMLDSCTTGHFSFRFNRLFVSLHEGENIIVYFPDKQSYIIQPERNYELIIKA